MSLWADVFHTYCWHGTLILPCKYFWKWIGDYCEWQHFTPFLLNARYLCFWKWSQRNGFWMALNWSENIQGVYISLSCWSYICWTQNKLRTIQFFIELFLFLMLHGWVQLPISLQQKGIRKRHNFNTYFLHSLNIF